MARYKELSAQVKKKKDSVPNDEILENGDIENNDK